MRYLRETLIVLLFLYTAPALAQQLLFEQPPVTLTGQATQPIAFASTLDVTDIPEDDKTIPNRAYDNFILDSNITLTGITWSGAYDGDFNPDLGLRSSVDFEVKIYENLSGNVPDVNSVLYTEVYDAGRAAIDDGSQVQKTLVPGVSPQSGGVVFDYSLDLDPVNLDAGSYWVSVRALMDFPSGLDFPDPAWAWLASPVGDNLTYNYDEELDNEIEPGFRVTGAVCENADLAGCDAAFSLFGTVTGGLLGDFDMNGELDLADIDLLAGAVRGGDTDSSWDVNMDGNVDADDHAFWVTDLKGTLPGDTDLNFAVDFSDFLKLSGSFGSEGPNGWGDGNFDTDTDVDFGDFLQLSANFGASIGGAASATQSVPEPSAGILFGLAALGMLVGRSRRS